MFKLYSSSRRVIRFRRFCHKAYAAFYSLHREVSIGRIAGYMTDLEMLKHGKSVTTALLLFAGVLPLPADEGVPDDSTLLTNRQLSLQEVLVVSHKAEVQSDAYRLITQLSRSEIESLPIQTVADILQYLPGVDIRTRGANGAQADISMRGGTFDQVLVLLNGVPLSDFQTGHYALNLPITPSVIERIEVLQGTSANLFGAFSGAINIITKSKVSHRPTDILFGLSAGMNGLIHPEFVLNQKSKIKNQKSEVYFGLAADYSRAEGYYAPQPTEKESIACHNSDFQLANIYFRSLWKGLDVQAGVQWKDAGAGMYYGFGSQDQFDATRTAFASVQYEHRWSKWRLEVQAAYRANYDRYEWHRGQTQYSNRHFAQTATITLATHYASRIGTTSFGVSLRNEHLRSTNLVGGNRFHVNYYAEQTFYYAGLAASIGLNGTYNTTFGHHLAGSANIGYDFGIGGTLYANAQRALRMPTFTDLYYDAGNQLGNPNLKPEEAYTASLGYKNTWKGLAVRADAYYRWGRNIIDWVYVPTDTKRPYHAENQQRVNATGVELSITYRLNEWLRAVSANYAYTYLDLDLKQTGSRYLDYLSHKLTLQLEHGIYKGFGACWTVRFQKREGQFNNAEGNVQDYQPIWLLDGSIYWQNKFLRISAECTNMTNTRYYDYGGILQPGAWAKVCIQAKLQ